MQNSMAARILHILVGSADSHSWTIQYVSIRSISTVSSVVLSTAMFQTLWNCEGWEDGWTEGCFEGCILGVVLGWRVGMHVGKELGCIEG